MLVLLIIFMVAAPLSTTSLNLTLPPPSPTRTPPPIAPVFVSLQKDGTIHVASERLGEGTADWRSLQALLRERANGNLAAPIFVRADRDVGYGDVMRLIDELRAAGYRQVSIVTEDSEG